MIRCPKCGSKEINSFENDGADRCVCDVKSCRFLWYRSEELGVENYWVPIDTIPFSGSGSWAQVPNGTLPIFQEEP